MSTFLDNWLLRRAMSAPREGGGGGEYVQDGLVFWLDGINKGSIPDAWENLVGNHSYYPFENKVTIETNAIVTNRQDVLTPSANQGVSADQGTIECCAQFLSQDIYGIIMYNHGANTLMLSNSGIGANKLMFRPDKDVNNGYLFTGANVYSPFTASMNAARGICNGIIGMQQIYVDWSFSEAQEWLGGRAGVFISRPYLCSVRIYSIRLYNRQLTQVEMLNNQQIDNERFNLGLLI